MREHAADRRRRNMARLAAFDRRRRVEQLLSGFTSNQLHVLALVRIQILNRGNRAKRARAIVLHLALGELRTSPLWATEWLRILPGELTNERR